MYDEACLELKTAEDLNRDTNLRQIGLASYNLGVYYLYQAKDIDQAEKQFLKALERYPGLPLRDCGSGNGLSEKGGHRKMLAMLMRENASRHRNDVEMINCYGLVLLKKGNAQGALKAAARSMELKWNDPQPWEISGEAWRRLGQWQKAAQCWEEALRLNPANPRAQLALVELYDRLKDGPGPRPHGGAMPGAQGGKAPGRMACRTRGKFRGYGLRGQSRNARPDHPEGNRQGVDTEDDDCGSEGFFLRVALFRQQPQAAVGALYAGFAKALILMSDVSPTVEKFRV